MVKVKVLQTGAILDVSEAYYERYKDEGLVLQVEMKKPVKVARKPRKAKVEKVEEE